MQCHVTLVLQRCAVFNKSLKSQKKKKKWTHNLAFKSHGESEDLKVARKFW